MGQRIEEKAADHDATPMRIDTDRCRVWRNVKDAGDDATPRKMNADRRGRRNTKDETVKQIQSRLRH